MRLLNIFRCEGMLTSGLFSASSRELCVMPVCVPLDVGLRAVSGPLSIGDTMAVRDGRHLIFASAKL